MISDPVGAISVGDVDLDEDKIGCVIKSQRLDVFVYDDGLIIRG
jgi:hypothetical protein